MISSAQYFTGKTVLVTGGAGAIGSNLVSGLLAEDARKVVVIDDLSSGLRWNLPDRSDVELIRATVLDDEALKRAFRSKPDVVYHLAALFANQNSIDHPETDLSVNGMGTLKVLQYAHLSGIQRFVYASSGCSIYGKAPMPLREDFVSLDLDSPYQITKMLGELYCNFYRNHYGLSVVRARFFNSYGPGEAPGRYRNVIPNFIYMALRGQSLPITGTGEETRDWTFVGDIVDGLLRSARVDAAAGEAINLSTGVETRVIDVANWINEATGNAGGVRYIERRTWDTKTRLLGSNEKARAILGFEPRVGVREGLTSTIEWFRSNWTALQAAAKF